MSVAGMPMTISGSASLGVTLMAPEFERNDRMICFDQHLLGITLVQETYGLPEYKENDQLDRQQLREWMMLRNVFLDLVVKLDKADHSRQNREGREDCELSLWLADT